MLKKPNVYSSTSAANISRPCAPNRTQRSRSAGMFVYMQHLSHLLAHTRLHASTLNHVSALRDAVDM